MRSLRRGCAASTVTAAACCMLLTRPTALLPLCLVERRCFLLRGSSALLELESELLKLSGPNLTILGGASTPPRLLRPILLLFRRHGAEALSKPAIGPAKMPLPLPP